MWVENKITRIERSNQENRQQAVIYLANRDLSTDTPRFAKRKTYIYYRLLSLSLTDSRVLSLQSRLSQENKVQRLQWLILC